ncbi:MAG: glycosyltransferase family 2 protein [Candidatus Gracilibacteria bacterium]|nr:glycosyltransferase family 2 protein [Candidatus Gracilibacteria bacterium]
MDSLIYSNTLKLQKSPRDETLQDWCSLFRGRIQKITSSDPIVSVIFPAFNEEAYLPVMLNALSNIQTSQSIEFIGVNNASTDRTAEILKESGIICIDEPKKGVSYARQTGLSEAKGEYIFTTDADTMVPEGWIDANLEYFNNDANLVCLSGGAVSQGAHWSYYVARFTVQTIRSIIGQKGEALMSFVGSNSVYKKVVAEAVGGYELGSDFGEDNIIARKMGSHGKILHIRDNPSTRVIMSARRTDTFSKVIHVIRDRMNKSWKNYEEIPSGITFQDAR